MRKEKRDPMTLAKKAKGYDARFSGWTPEGKLKLGGQRKDGLGFVNYQSR
jgi:hypothetical protein